ncbi:MAG: YCF48-related protein [Bryobacteraceae bacterium]
MRHPRQKKRIWGETAAALAFVFLCLPGATLAAQRWEVQFFHDKDESALEFRDLQCPSPQRCIAVGVLQDEKHRPKGTGVVTSDGGEHWSYVELKELPVSLFFLNDSIGWMATANGIWQTGEAGRSWKKLKGLKGIERLWFQDPAHGWAVGYPKAIYETIDGGKNWTKSAAAQKPATPAEETDFTSISFKGPLGIIAGNWVPGQHQALPAWMDPANERRTFPRQSTTLFLQTVDGGKNWELLNRSGDGYVSRLRLSALDFALVLFEFPDRAGVPSGLFRIDHKTHKAVSIFEQSGMVVRDLAILPDGDVLLAAIELAGKSSQIPIPGKLKILHSRSLQTWLDIPVDYRATATRPVIAAADSTHIWVATDTGMILKLTE